MRFMLTLTFGSTGVYERSQAHELTMRFLQRHPQPWLHKRYVCVYELHKSHGWHVHLLTPYVIPVVALRIQWTAWLRHHAITSTTALVRIHAKDWGSAKHAARYAGKYVSKDLGSEAKGLHRYARGECTESPNVLRLTVYASTLSDVKHELALLGVPEDARAYVPTSSEFPLVTYEWDT